MRSKRRLVLWVLILVGALAALHVAWGRWQAERANRTVEIVLDWDEVRSLSDETGTPVDRLLRDFYSAGARGIAVGEESVGEMQTLHRLEIVPPEPTPSAPSATTRPMEMTTRLRIPDANLRARIVNTLQHKWDVTVSPDGEVLTVPAAWTDVAGVTIGFPPDVIALVRANHLEPVLRVTNFTGANTDSISWTADKLEAAHGRLVIFGGDQVLGYPDGVKETAKAFGARGLLFGQVEFGKQKGEDALALALRGSIVRVHSINPTEMTRLTVADDIDRFLRAAEERNLRAMYVRLLPGAPVPVVTSNVKFVNDISRALTGHGMTLGFAQPFRPFESDLAARMLVGLGVGASTLLLVSYLWPATGLLLTLVLALAALDIVLPLVGIGRKLVALQGAILMPVLAFLILRVALEHRYGHAVEARTDETAHYGSLLGATLRWPVLRLFLGVTLVSLLGALWEVGLLSSRLATMRITTFAGVKVQQAGTLVLVAVIYYLDIAARGGLARARARVRRRVQALWSQPILLGSLVIGFVALVALALLIARSGNEPGVGVSPIELHMRALLDRIMGVRPRTKEYLIGHPALILGIALVSLRRVRWALPLLIVGVIGQAGIVNTFSHLHTPLWVSILHTVNGVWTGILVALVVAFIIDRIAPARKKV